MTSHYHSLFTKGSDELLDNKMYKRAKSLGLPERLVGHLIRSSNSAVLVAHFVEEGAKTAIVTEAKIRKDIIREITV